MLRLFIVTHGNLFPWIAYLLSIFVFVQNAKKLNGLAQIKYSFENVELSNAVRRIDGIYIGCTN